MSKKHFTIKVLNIILAITFMIPACSKQPKKDTKTNVAYVNNSPISRQQLKTEMNRLKQRFYGDKMSVEQKKQMKKEVLEILIGGKILYMASQEKGLKVTAKEIDDFRTKSKKAYPDTNKFKNNFTDSDLRQQIAINKFITKEFADKTKITDEESKKYYNDNINDFTQPAQVMASHILIKVSPNASKEDKAIALKKINDVQNKLQGGADFAAIAKKYSEDKSKENGGNLGFFMKGQMAKPFEDEAFRLKIGEVSKIVTTKFGYHIIKVTDKKPAVVIPYKEIEVKLKNYLKQRAIQAKIEKFIAKRKKTLKIETYL